MTQRVRAAVGAAALALPAPLLMAGEPAWAIMAIGVLGSVSAAFLVRTHSRPLHTIEADYFVLGALLWTLMQLVPVPGSWSHGLVSRGRSLAGLSGWAPLSIDPGSTREKVVVAGIAFFAYAVGRLCSRSAGRRVTLYIVAASCAVVACVSFGHELLNAQRVFGIYEPLESAPVLMSPILNSNHLGGLLALGSVIWLGLAASSSDRRVILGDAAMALLCTLGALGSGSRGAALSLGLGFAAGLWVLFRRREPGAEKGAQRFVLVLGVAGIALSVFGVTMLDGFITNVTRGDYSKLELIRNGASASFIQPLIGVGRGAFEAAFAAEGTSSIRFTHPENILVQWTAEWGWAFSLVAFGVWGRYFVRCLRSERVYVAVASGAAVAMVIHEQFDFALEMPGVLAVFMVLLGGIAPKGKRGRLRVPQQYALSGVVSVICVLAALGMAERRVSSTTAQSQRVSEAELQAFAEEVVYNHPADPIATLAVATAMARHDDPMALHWLNRTLELAPGWSAPHVFSAGVLARRGAYSQALVEAYEAERLRPQSAQVVSCRLARRVPLAMLLRVSTPRSDEASERTTRALFADQLSACMDDEKRALFDEQLIQSGANGGALIRRARERWRAGDPAGALGDLETVPEELRDLDYLLLRARVMGEESPLAAFESLANVTPGEGRDAWRLLATQAELAGSAGREEALEHTLSNLRRLGAGDAARIAAAWAVAGQAYRNMDRPETAADAYMRAHRLAPGENAYLWALARLARAQGRGPEATRYLRNLCRRGEDRACED